MKLGVFADWVAISDRGKRTHEWWRGECAWLAGLGVSDVVIGVASVPFGAPRWSPFSQSPRTIRWSRGNLICAVQEAREAGLSAHLMIWGHRNRNYLIRALGDLREWRAESGAGLIILDAEDDWHAGAHAVDACVQVVERELYASPWAVTGLGPIHRTVRPLAERATITIPQAYSIWHPEDPSHWSRSPATARRLVPPGFQRRCWEQWHHVSDRVELGLAAYWLARPGMKAAEVAEEQLVAALDLGCSRAWYWSLRHLRRSAETRAAIGRLVHPPAS